MMPADVVILETVCLFVRQAPCPPGLPGEPLGVSLIGRLQGRRVLQKQERLNILEGWHSQPLQDLHRSTLRHTKHPPQQILGVEREERGTPSTGRVGGWSLFEHDLHGTPFPVLFNRLTYLLERYAQRLQDSCSNALSFAKQTQQEMFSAEGVVLEVPGFFKSQVQHLPGLFSERVETIAVVHSSFLTFHQKRADASARFPFLRFCYKVLCLPPLYLNV